MTAPTAEALKPCPFCGGRAEITEGKWSGKTYYGVECAEDCGVWMDARELTEDGATSAWNRRALSAVPDDGLGSSLRDTQPGAEGAVLEQQAVEARAAYVTYYHAPTQENWRRWAAAQVVLEQAIVALPVAPEGVSPRESARGLAPRTEPVFALREACHRMADDYQTSEAHHPDHVLVRRDHFEAMRAMLQAAPSPSLPTGDAEGAVVGLRRTDVQRLMHPVLHYLRERGVHQRIAEEASERAVDAAYRGIVAPNAPVSPAAPDGLRPFVFVHDTVEHDHPDFGPGRFFTLDTIRDATPATSAGSE